MNLFLKQDQEQAQKEAESFRDCMIMATVHGYQNDYDQVAKYLETAARSVKELDRMKQKKTNYVEIMTMVKQIEAQQQVDKLTFELRNRQWR